MIALPLLAAAAPERQDGPFIWIALGLVLGLVVGFVFAALRALVRRRARP